MKTTTTVGISRRVVSIGISARRPLPSARSSGDTLGKLPAGDLLQTLKRPVYPAYEGFGERLALPDGGDERRAGDQIGDVVLAEIDEREAEGPGVAPAEGALDLAGFRERERRGQRGGEVERGHR